MTALYDNRKDFRIGDGALFFMSVSFVNIIGRPSCYILKAFASCESFS